MGVIRPKTSKKNTMLLMRILCVVFIAFSLYLALRPNIIVNLMAFSWGAVSGTFLAPYVLGLYSKKITKAGAWAGMVTGVSFCVVFSLLFPTQIPLVGSLSMIIPIFITLLVSRFTRSLNSQFLDTLFEEKTGTESVAS